MNERNNLVDNLVEITNLVLKKYKNISWKQDQKYNRCEVCLLDPCKRSLVTKETIIQYPSAVLPLSKNIQACLNQFID